MNIDDKHVLAALRAWYMDDSLLWEDFATDGIDPRDRMRAALTAFLSSVGGEPVAWVRSDIIDNLMAGDSVLTNLHNNPFSTKGLSPLYTAEAVAASAAGDDSIDTLALRMLVAAGHVSQNLVEQSRSIASGVLPGPIELATHPATARAGVDLEQFRAAVEAWKDQADMLLDPDARTAEADRLLSLIDQQGADRG